MLPTKSTPQTLSGGPLKQSQINCAQSVDNNISNENYYYKNSSILENDQSECMYRKMNFTSSTVMTATKVPLITPEIQTQRFKTYTDREPTANKNENQTIRNVDTRNIKPKSSFGSTSTINSIVNCRSEISQKIFAQGSTSNVSEIPTNKRSSQDKPEQIFGTQVTKRKLNFFIFF